ncbi:MAG: flavin reductase family protein [Proteobacteria bacterium]|nr:flavin reductase family protein [Pseudomonadota bacterium]MBU1740478.1 flavin reductase family protein [Pseudomonadota bacterium]
MTHQPIDIDPGREEGPITRVLTGVVNGLYVVTSGRVERPAVMAVSMVSQVSAEPPLLMMAVRHNRRFRTPLEQTRGFVLHLLPADDIGLIQRLKGPPRTRLRDLVIEPSPQGLPLLPDTLAALECRLVDTFTPGDHVLYFGQVTWAKRFREGRALSLTDYGHVYTGRR